MKKLKIIIKNALPISLVLFFSAFAHAGSWISSGGDFLKDASNPWFVRNTQEVRYCILIDENSVSASKTEIENLVSKAINFWQKEFVPFNNYKFLISLGTQKFLNLNNCDGSEDIRFQFGAGTLTQEQINFFKKSQTPFTQVIAQTTRTEYSHTTLQARGFVYVASDKGNNSYETGGRLITQAWQHSGLLYRVLVHEMGHIFGLPHLGSGLMSEAYMEEILDKRFYAEYSGNLDLGSFFQGPNESSSCKLGQATQKFFQLDSSNQCLFVEKLSNDSYKITTSKDLNGVRKEVGRMDFEKVILGEGNFDSETQRGINLWLPTEQKVFSSQEINNQSTLAGPTFLSFSRSAKFFFNGSNKSSDLMFKSSPGMQQLIGQTSDGMRIIYSAVTDKRGYAQ